MEGILVFLWFCYGILGDGCSEKGRELVCFGGRVFLGEDLRHWGKSRQPAKVGEKGPRGGAVRRAHGIRARSLCRTYDE